MDFDTVRKKFLGGVYLFLEQLEVSEVLVMVLKVFLEYHIAYIMVLKVLLQ